MSFSDELLYDNKVDNGDNNCEKVLKPFITSSPTMGTVRAINPLIIRRKSPTIIKYSLLIFLHAGIFLVLCDVFIKPCHSQLDIGMH